MRILITGSTGFIGKHLVTELKENNIVFEHTRKLPLKISLEEFQPDTIIHCAGEIYNPEEMWEPNLLYTYTCLEYVKNNPKTKMIHLGSSSEYGLHTAPSSEQDCPKPRNMYEGTKAAASMLCIGYAKEYNLDINIIRPYSVYGTYEKSSRLFPRLYRAYKYGEGFTLYAGNHDFIYIKDFVRGVLLLLNKSFCGEIFNLGSGIMYSNLTVYNTWKELGKEPQNVEYKNEYFKSFDSALWVANMSKSKKLLGFETQYNLKEGILDFIKEQEKIESENK